MFGRYPLLASTITVLACDNPTATVDPCLCPPPPPDHVTVDTSPSWSPDGATIAYYRFFHSSAGPHGIYFIQSDGTNNRLLYESQVWTRDLRFSPDGTWLSMTIGLEVFIFTIKDSTLRQLTTTNGNAEMADWSPDAKSLVITSPFIRYPGDGGLHIIDVSTGAARGLNYNSARVYGRNPRWSPTSNLIAFSTTDNRAYEEIFTIQPDGSDLRRVTNAEAENGRADDPRWLYAGTHLLYRWTSRSGTRPIQTRTIRLDGSEPSTMPFEVYYYDAISPDSRQIVTTAAQDSTHTIGGLPVWTLSIRDIDDGTGSSLRQLTSYWPPPDTTATAPPSAHGRGEPRPLDRRRNAASGSGQPHEKRHRVSRTWRFSGIGLPETGRKAASVLQKQPRKRHPKRRNQVRRRRLPIGSIGVTIDLSV